MRRKDQVSVGLTLLVDALAISVAFALARFETRVVHMVEQYGLAGQYYLPGPVHIGLFFIFIPVWLSVFLAFGLYSRRRVMKPPIMLLSVAVTLDSLIFYVLGSFIDEIPKTAIVMVWVTSSLLVVIGRLALSPVQRALAPGLTLQS